MLPVLWLFFIVINGKLNLEIVLVGLGVSLVAMLLSCLFLNWSFGKEKRLWKLIPCAVLYLGRLLWEVFKANVDVLRRIYSLRKQEPVIRYIDRRFASEWQSVLLANSITLTPGTLTLRLSDDSLIVHCLDEQLSNGLVDSAFDRGIEKLGEVIK